MTDKHRRGRRRRIFAWSTAAGLAVMALTYVAAGWIGLPAWAQPAGQGREPTGVLTEQEVEAGLVLRIEGMQQRQAEYLVRLVEERSQLSPAARAVLLEGEEPLPRDPDPAVLALHPAEETEE
jgi:hypothetical protein